MCGKIEPQNTDSASAPLAIGGGGWHASDLVGLDSNLKKLADPDVVWSQNTAASVRNNLKGCKNMVDTNG